MKSIVIDMVRKAPKPSEMDSYGEDDGDGPDKEDAQDEDADMASARTAMQDYIKAVKSGDVDQSLELFKELVGHCK